MTSKAITIRDYHTEIIGAMSPDKLEWTFPTIKGTNNLGKQIEWTIFVKAVRLPYANYPVADIKPEMYLLLDNGPLSNGPLDNKPLPDDVYGMYEVRSCVVGGKIRVSVPTIIKAGKSLKSKSATNTICQALRDALGKYNKQLQKTGAITDEQIAAKMYPPMLAQIYTEQKKHEFPVSVQRKYNGIRACITLDDNGAVVIYSRKLKVYYGFAAIREEARLILTEAVGAKLYLDGELYKHGLELQVISGITRRDSIENSAAEDGIQFYVYDCFTADNSLTYLERKTILESLFGAVNGAKVLEKCVLTETFVANNEDEISALYKQFLADGYEGAMIRQNKIYDFSYNDRHSKFLLKMKEKFDAEYKIIGWTTGTKGKAANSLMIICETTDGEQFNVTPALTIKEREILAAQMPVIEQNGLPFFDNTYLGRMVNVEFDEKSIKGVPQRARTKMVIRSWD